MKKKFLLCVLFIMAMMLLVACGDKKNNISKDNVIENDYKTENDVDNDNENEKRVEDTNDKDFIGEETVESVEEAIEMEFERLAEWDSWNGKAADIVQIADVIIPYGSQVKMVDALDEINKSKLAFEYEYSPDGIVGAYSGDYLKVKYNGELWFSLYYSNMTDSAISKADAILSTIKIEDEIKRYVRYIDGRTFGELCELTYMDVMSMSENVFSEFNDPLELSSGDGPYIVYDPATDDVHMRYYIRFNEETGKVVNILLGGGIFE